MIYLVMPFLEGEPLSEHETRRGPFSVAEGMPLLVQVCHGLQHAHELQIIHRDLKPENIMLVPDGDGEAASRDSARWSWISAWPRSAGPGPRSRSSPRPASCSERPSS